MFEKTHYKSEKYKKSEKNIISPNNLFQLSNVDAEKKVNMFEKTHTKSEKR